MATYDEAKKAKQILLEYISDGLDYSHKDSHRQEMLLYLALTQEYFLD